MPARRDPEEPFRPNLYVVARFLDALHEAPRTRSQLQAAVGVNYDILRRYVEVLEVRGLLRVDEDGTLRATAEGRRVRAELRAWIERFLGPPDGGGEPQTLKDDRSAASPQ